MALTKHKLGELICQRREKYNGIETLPLRGVSREGFIPAKKSGAGTNQIFYKNDFVFNPARMELNSIAFNRAYERALCSSTYEIFFVSKPQIILPEYLNLFVKRSEFARLCDFLGTGSVRECCHVADIAEIEINLPSLAVQKKFVAVYLALLENKKVYERGLDDLKLVCEGYIEDLRRKFACEKIRDYIQRHDDRNSGNRIKKVMGISVKKFFREPTSKVNRDELSNYKIVEPRQIGFVQTTHNEKVFACAFNDTNENLVISSVHEVFSTDEKYLLSEYLMLFFLRSEYDRYARFHSWGSAREVFSWKDLCEVEIPIPDMEIQRSIAAIYEVYRTRKKILEKLKTQIKDICPILIKGSLDEGATT